jgi:chaperonin GroEL
LKKLFDVDGEALATFVLNKIRGGLNVLAIKAPGYGDRKKEMLADIAVTIGATVITEDTGLTFEKAELIVVGKAARIVATKDKTIIVGGKGNKTQITERIQQLKMQKNSVTGSFDKEKIDERIAKLSGGVAVIKVGAATETEMKYLKLKIEDAVAATKAAIEEGIVAGGGSALITAGRKIKKESADNKDSEFVAGFNLVLSAIEHPLKNIAINAGVGDGSIVVEKVKEMKTDNAGYNAATGVYESDMVKAGIIDPVKVTRSALQHAASAAAILLTTEVAIAEELKEDKSPVGNSEMMRY